MLQKVWNEFDYGQDVDGEAKRPHIEQLQLQVNKYEIFFGFLNL